MKAVVLREVGGDLALEEWEEPHGESVVDVRAAGVNFLDVLIRRGLYPQMPDLPYVLGTEIAGELEGRRVAALPGGGGGYAERAEVDPQWVFDLPAHASFAAGASFLMTYLTAYIPLVVCRPAETVLQYDGNVAVGQFPGQQIHVVQARHNETFNANFADSHSKSIQAKKTGTTARKATAAKK